LSYYALRLTLPQYPGREKGLLPGFLDIADARCGEILYYSAIGRDTALPTRTVQEYYQILEDTLLGFKLESWRRSPRAAGRSSEVLPWLSLVARQRGGHGTGTGSTSRRPWARRDGRVELEIIPPKTPGTYTLRIEPVQEAIAWFADAGVYKAEAAVKVFS
jgi:hypothetical protein